MKKNNLKISERLIERLNSEFGLDILKTEKPRRLYHGYHQRAIGAWSWAIGGNKSMKECYGSQWPMKEILYAPKISLFTEAGGDISILPE